MTFSDWLFPNLKETRSFRQKFTLQSNIALVCTGLARATDRPTLTGWSSESIRSWKGWEFGRHSKLARGAPLPPPPLLVSAGMSLSTTVRFGSQ